MKLRLTSRLCLFGSSLLAALTLSQVAPAAVRPATGGTLRLSLEEASGDASQSRTLSSRIRGSLRDCHLGDLLAGPPRIDEDEQRLLLRIEDGLVFQDGSPIRAAEVVASFERLGRSGGSVEGWRLLVIAGASEPGGEDAVFGLRAAGVRTLELRLAFPLGAEALSLLSHPGLPIRSDKGSPCGPFLARSEGREGVLVPFDRQPRGRPYFDRVQLISAREGARHGVSDLRLAPAGDTPRELPIPSRSLTFLQVNGSDALREQIGASLDRVAIVRYLVGGRARAQTHLLGDAPGVAERASPDPAPRRPLVLAFDGENPVHRRIAERIQVRLHDGGLTVSLSPVPARERASLLTGATELALITLPGLPRDATRALAAVSHAVLGPRAAFEVLATAQQTEAQGETLGATLGPLEARLPVVLLYGEEEAVWIGDSLQGASPSGTLPFDPGALWRWDASP